MESIDVCVQLENDEFYSKYLRDDTEAGDGGSGDGLSVGERVDKLSAGVDKLNAHLEKQVLLKHTDLLTRASHVADLEAELDDVQEHAARLLRGTASLRTRVGEQHAALRGQTAVLDRALATCHLLRHAARALALWRHLPAEPARLALVLHETGELLADYRDLRLLLPLGHVVATLDAERARLLDTATRDLHESLLAGDKARLLLCFRVFRNMQQTEERIRVTVDSILSELRRQLRSTLDVQPPAPPVEHKRGSRAGPGRATGLTSADIKQRLWDDLDRLFKRDIHTGCAKVIMLQNVLNELHTIGKFRHIARDFWDDLCSILASELERSSVQVNECVQIDFPQLVKLLGDLVASLKRKELTVKRERLATWENSFLSRWLGRLLDPVRSMWHLHAVPGPDELDGAVRVVASALSVSLGDRQLSVSLATSAAKAVKQMTLEVEQRLAVDADAAQIIAAPTTSQQKNADLCNALYYFSSRVSRVLANMKSTLPAESAALVRDALRDTTSAPVLRPLAASIDRSLHLILLTMHDEPDLSRADDPAGRTLSCCPYMKELHQFVSRCKDIYLTMFADKTSVDECCKEIARKCIERFLQHACVVRPLTRYGRVKLQQDCRQLETTLGTMLEVSEAGEAHRRLKALAMLLDKSPSEIVRSQAEGASLPYSYVAMFLFAFGGPQLVSPHACAGWTVPRLLDWLDTHPSERDRLELVTGAVQRYQAHVRQQQLTNYDDVFPLIVQLVQDGRDAL